MSDECIWCEQPLCTVDCGCIDCTNKPTIWDLADEAYERTKDEGY